MKATVLEVFIDKYTGCPYKVGEVIDLLDQGRVKDLEERKLILVEKEETVVKKKPTTRKKKGE